MKKHWIAGALALLAMAPVAWAQNLSLRAPDWAQGLLVADVTPTTGGRANLNETGVAVAARITIVPLQGGVARVVRFEVRGDDATIALRRFTGHPTSGWWMWGPDTPYVSHPTAAQRDEIAGLVRAAMGEGATVGGAEAAACGVDGEEAYVEMAAGGQSFSATRTCVRASDTVGKLAARMSELAGSRTDEELHAAARSELLDADRAFAAMAQSQGVAAAFTHYAAQDATLIRGGQPVQGAAAVTAAYAHWPQGARLQWAPSGGNVSERGDMGWTWGRGTYTSAAGASEPVGYVSIWKRDYEGNWRFALDAPLDVPAAPARAPAHPTPAQPPQH